ETWRLRTAHAPAWSGGTAPGPGPGPPDSAARTDRDSPASTGSRTHCNDNTRPGHGRRRERRVRGAAAGHTARCLVPGVPGLQPNRRSSYTLVPVRDALARAAQDLGRSGPG